MSGGRAEVLEDAIKTWALGYRMPCHSGTPVDTSILFVFYLDDAHYGFKDITLMAFLYRYAFILVDECQHMLMAFRSRRGSSGPIPLSTWGAMAGQLLLRTFGRAERIYQAVLCRGGEDPEFVNSRSVITGRGAAGGLLFCILVILFRCFNITMLAGQYARSLIP